jgi:hypothetical protein
MNTVTSVAPVITADRDALRRDFPYKPFAIRHRLAGHPLLILDLGGDHLEDARSAPSQRPAFLRCCTASACRSGRPAGSRCATRSSSSLSHGDDGDPPVARLDGDAPRAAAVRTG